MVEGVGARDDSARAVAQEVDRQLGMALLGYQNQTAEVRHVFGDVLDVEPSPFGLAAAAQVDGEAAGDELPGRPGVLPAMGVHAVADDHHASRPLVGIPRAVLDTNIFQADEVTFLHRLGSS